MAPIRQWVLALDFTKAVVIGAELAAAAGWSPYFVTIKVDVKWRSIAVVALGFATSDWPWQLSIAEAEFARPAVSDVESDAGQTTFIGVELPGSGIHQVIVTVATAVAATATATAVIEGWWGAFLRPATAS